MLVAASLLGGCALLGANEAPRDTYELTAPDNFGSVGATRAQILVKTPTALKSIDSDRIVVRPEPKIITYLAGAQWSDTLPRMVQAKLIAAFENSGSVGAAAQPGDGLVIDFQLIAEIRRFGIVTPSGRAEIEMSIKLLSDKSGKVLETRIFEGGATSAGTTPEAYVQALDAAFDGVARDVVRWVLNRV